MLGEKARARIKAEAKDSDWLGLRVLLSLLDKLEGAM
jgi:hypothetical protein